MIAVVGGVALIAILVYFFRDQIGEAFGSDEAEKTREAEAAARRDEKGAIGNTVDWLFGEGTHERNKAKNDREREAPQQEITRRNNVNAPAPDEPTPWEAATKWWQDNVGVHFEFLDDANPPAPPADTQGPASQEVPEVISEAPTEAQPQAQAAGCSTGRQAGRRGPRGRC